MTNIHPAWLDTEYVRWYLDNGAWLAAVTSGEYHNWISLNYAAGTA